MVWTLLQQTACATTCGVSGSAVRFASDPARLYRRNMDDSAALTDGLRIVRDGGDFHVVSKAGYILATNSTRWREGAVAQTLEQLPDEFGIRLHEDLRATCWYCPASGALLSVDFHYKHRNAPDDAIIEPQAIKALLDA